MPDNDVRYTCPLCSRRCTMLIFVVGLIFPTHYRPADEKDYRPVVTPCESSGYTLPEAQGMAQDQQVRPRQYVRPHP